MSCMSNNLISGSSIERNKGMNRDKLGQGNRDGLRGHFNIMAIRRMNVIKKWECREPKMKKKGMSHRGVGKTCAQSSWHIHF